MEPGLEGRGEQLRAKISGLVLRVVQEMAEGLLGEA